MNHETYDRIADWLEAHRWTQTAACYLGSFAVCYGLLLGIFVALPWLLLILGLPLAWLVLRVQWHGFLRRLDREYPTTPCDTDCMEAAR